MKTLILFFSLINISFGSILQNNIVATYSDSELVLNTLSGNSIYGTLSIPEDATSTPLIIFIPGSGSPDRDGNMPPVLQTNTFKMLSESLVANGISTLRYDKRGAGKSRAAITNESEIRFEDYISDVVGWISLLKTDKRFSKIILLGHSEGSLIGMLAAKQTDIASFISIAGVGKSVDKLLKEQLKSLPPQLLSESNKIIDSLKVGETVSNVNPNLLSIFRPSLQPYLISWMKYDPSKEIAELKIPTLIIQGTTDLQVTVNDANLLSAAKPDAKLLIIENMNHVLKESSSDVQENSATYRNPKLPLKSGLIDEIVSFVNRK